MRRHLFLVMLLTLPLSCSSDRAQLPRYDSDSIITSTVDIVHFAGFDRKANTLKIDFSGSTTLPDSSSTVARKTTYILKNWYPSNCMFGTGKLLARLRSQKETNQQFVFFCVRPRLHKFDKKVLVVECESFAAERVS